jgi:hypothetical protein
MSKNQIRELRDEMERWDESDMDITLEEWLFNAGYRMSARMDSIQDVFELQYYQTVCQIQNDCIKEKISKEECEQKLEIERLKYISYLQMLNRQMIAQMKHEERMRKSIIWN